MEPQNLTQEEALAEQESPLYQVTPLSKYLAMALFIIFPFLGGYIGYHYAPEKVVEVEKIIYVENEEDEAETIENKMDDSIVYENNFFRLTHPEDCMIKDYLKVNESLKWLSTSKSYIGICDVGHDSMGSVRVIPSPTNPSAYSACHATL